MSAASKLSFKIKKETGCGSLSESKHLFGLKCSSVSVIPTEAKKIKISKRIILKAGAAFSSRTYQSLLLVFIRFSVFMNQELNWSSGPENVVCFRRGPHSAA